MSIWPGATRLESDRKDAYIRVMLNQTPATKPLNIRMPTDLRAALDAKAKQSRRTVTSLVLEGVEKVVYSSEPKVKKTSMADFVAKYAGSGRIGEGLDEKGMAARMRLIRGDD